VAQITTNNFDLNMANKILKPKERSVPFTAGWNNASHYTIYKTG
jgi:hypothetical protein